MSESPTAWLIERYYNSDRVKLPGAEFLVVESASYRWTTDANEARRFPTIYDAWIMGECVLRGVTEHAWKPVEHRWCSGPDLSQPWSPSAVLSQ